MIDIRLIRENPDLVRENIRKKFQDAKLPLVDEVIELDKANCAAINEASNLRAERNSLSKKIGMLMGQAKKDPSKLEEAEAVKAQVTAQAARLAELEKQEEELEAKIHKIMLTIPQIIDPSVPLGPDDSHMLSLLFRDPNWLGKAKADKLADRLFKLASNVQSTELRHQLSLYDIFTDEELYQHWLCNNAFWYLTYGPSTINGGNQPFSQRNLLHKIISQADSCIALPHPGATLRYGHDTMVMPLVCLLDLNGYGRPVSDIEQLPAVGWCDYRIFPMACNVQWIFYRRSVDDKDVLVKILLNEDEARLPISTDCAPYYHWSDVRRYYLDKLASYKPQPLQK